MTLRYFIKQAYNHIESKRNEDFKVMQKAEQIFSEIGCLDKAIDMKPQPNSESSVTTEGHHSLKTVGQKRKGKPPNIGLIEKILASFKNNPKKTNNQVAEELGISTAMVSHYKCYAKKNGLADMPVKSYSQKDLKALKKIRCVSCAKEYTHVEGEFNSEGYCKYCCAREGIANDHYGNLNHVYSSVNGSYSEEVM